MENLEIIDYRKLDKISWGLITVYLDQVVLALYKIIVLRYYHDYYTNNQHLIFHHDQIDLVRKN
jgi:hypothetical protein